MATQQELLIKIKGDVADIQAKLVQVQSKTKETSKGFESIKKTVTTVAKGTAVALGAIGGALAGLTAIGSKYNGEVQQTAFLLERLDATTQELINTKAKEAGALAMTEKQYTDAATSMGTFMKSMGLTTEEANKLIPQMVQLAADGAAFANVPMDDAMAAISSAAMGNYEALGKLNIEMSDALINNGSYAKNLGKTTQQMTAAEKTQAIYNTMLERGGHLSGFAASESDSFAAQMNLTKTKVYEAAGALGEKLLPLFTPLIEKVGEIADKLKQAIDVFSEAYDATGDFSDALQVTLDAFGLSGWADFIGKLEDMAEWIGQIPAKLREWEQPLTVAAILIGSLATAIGIYSLAQNWALITTGIGVGMLNVWSAVCAVATGVTGAFATVMAFLTSPITLVILAIGALIAIGYLLYKNWGEISAWLKELWEGIKAKAVEIWGAIDAYLTEKLGSIWTSIKSIVGSIITFWKTSWDNTMNLFKGVWDGITQIWNAFGKLFSGDWKGFWEGIKGAFATIWNSIKTFFSSQLSNFTQMFSNIIPNMMNIGRNIIDGLLNGLKNAWGAVTGWISNAASSIGDKFKSILGIHSPSRVFMKIGGYVDEGLLKGLEAGELDITSQVTGMAKGLSTDFNGSIDNDNKPGPVAQAANTTINLNGSYMFQDKDAMDYFLNRLALVNQRG